MYIKDNIQIGKRLMEIQIELKIKSVRQLAMSIGMDVSYMTKVMKGALGISDKYVIELNKKFSINSDWLLFGQGKMFGTYIPNNELNIKSKVGGWHVKNNTGNNLEKELLKIKIKDLEKSIESKDETISSLNKIIGGLEKTIEFKNNIIESRKKDSSQMETVKSVG